MLYKPGLSTYKKDPPQSEDKVGNEWRQDGLSFAGIKLRDEIDEKMGFSKYLEGEEKLGWLVNIQEVLSSNIDID
jgi:DNA polymerase epsilon subunit 1